jgi:hypothetical protein
MAACLLLELLTSWLSCDVELLMMNRDKEQRVDATGMKTKQHVPRDRHINHQNFNRHEFKIRIAGFKSLSDEFTYVFYA